jgi:hypothetical protein
MASKTKTRKRREQLKLKKAGRERKKRLGRASPPASPIPVPERHAGLTRPAPAGESASN